MELLEKLDLDYDNLSEEEKKDYSRLQEALKTPNKEIGDLINYCKAQIDRLEQEITDYQNTPLKDLYLKMSLRNFKSILSFLSTPEKIREQAQKEINKITKTI